MFLIIFLHLLAGMFRHFLLLLVVTISLYALVGDACAHLFEIKS